jgi:hypothetical protein
MPTTTTVSPGFTSARLVAEPHPVATPQETSETASNGRSGSTLITCDSATTVRSANVPSLANNIRSSPPAVWCRCDPSVTMPLMKAPAPSSHRLCRPVEQYRQRPQEGMNEADT